MELRRRYRWTFALPAFSGASLQLLYGLAGRPWTARVGNLLLAAILLAVGLLVVRAALRPFRFRIDEDGLTMRGPAGERLLAWSEIDMVILEQLPPGLTVDGFRQRHQLLLVPAAGVDLGLPLTGRSPLDDRACLPVLDFADVADTPQAVAAMLGLLGGDRFADDRDRLRRDFAPPAFAVVPHGYDRAHVDDVIRRGRDLLTSTSRRARREIAAELLPPHPTAHTGYDPAQVDPFTHRLSTAIAALPGVCPPSDAPAPGPAAARAT